MPLPKSRQWMREIINVRMTPGSASRGPPVIVEPADKALSQEDAFYPVVAEVLGALALHEGRTALGRPKWIVTHAPSGLAITAVDDKADARRMAEHLWATVRTALECADHRRVSRLTPLHVKDWLRRCRQAGHWIDPD